MALTNFILAGLALVASVGIFSELTSTYIHDGSESVAVPLGEAEHGGVAILIVVTGMTMALLLSASAIGYLGRRSWARAVGFCWVALAIAAQDFLLIVRPDGFGLGYEVLRYGFVVVTLYALVTASALFGSLKHELSAPPP